MSKENETENTPGVELEQENPTPPVEENTEDIADTLTSADLEATLTKVLDEREALADSSTDDEEEELEEEEEEPKELGMFPLLLITGVIVVGVASILLNNRPNISHEPLPEKNHE